MSINCSSRISRIHRVFPAFVVTGGRVPEKALGCENGVQHNVGLCCIGQRNGGGGRGSSGICSGFGAGGLGALLEKICIF